MRTLDSAPTLELIRPIKFCLMNNPLVGLRFASAKTAVQTALFGYDFFICYRTADAAAYARSLQTALAAKGFDCFLDVQHYEAGHNLQLMQSRALNRSTKLLVVISPLAHDSPARSTDWVLAEVREFSYLTQQRNVAPKIVPIGTPNTFSVEQFPRSKLLPYIPTPGNGAICIFDEGVELNGIVDAKTVEKLDADFHETRRRRLRYTAAVGALMVIVAAFTFGGISLHQAAVARRDEAAAIAFRKVARARVLLTEEHGGEPAQVEAKPEDPYTLFAEAAQELQAAGHDPLMGRHGKFAASLKEIVAERIIPISKEASYLKVSADGRWMLVVHDYQAPNGSPDIEDIPDWAAFEVLNLAERKQVLIQPLRSEIGREIYGVYPGDLIALEGPDHVIVRMDDAANGKTFFRVSLKDGSRSKWDDPAGTKQQAEAVPKEKKARGTIADAMANITLFTHEPNDGIDQAYGPRLVAETRVESPDGRTALVGTYEGRLLLLDLWARMPRGEIRTNTIYAAAYSPDGNKAYFCDKSNLWEVDATGQKQVHELQLPLRRSTEPQGLLEEVLGIAESDDASVLAVATTERLFSCIIREGTWREWLLPNHISGVAAIQVDQKRERIDLVSADNGVIASVGYHKPSSSLETVARPGNKEASVAWFDDSAALVWLTGVNNEQGKVTIHGVPLPGKNTRPVKLGPVVLRNEEPFLGQESVTVHGIAKGNQGIMLFFGDKDFYREDSEVINEEMLLIPQCAGTTTRRVLFKAEKTNTGIGPFWTCNQVKSIRPSVRAGDRFFIETNIGYAHYLLNPDGVLSPSLSGLFVREYREDTQAHLISIIAEKNDASVYLKHPASGTWLKYALPWSSDGYPKFAVIAPDGLSGAVASPAGDILLFDLERDAWPSNSSR